MLVGSKRILTNRQLFSHELTRMKYGYEKERGFSFQKSVKVRVHQWLSASWSVLRKSQCLRGRALRLPRLRWENLGSFPWRVGRDQPETLFAGDHAADAAEQNIFVTLQLPRPSVGSSSDPRLSTAAAREALPFARGACQARSRTYSPRPPHSLRTKRAHAALLHRRCGSPLARA